jgi:hypothetical protein
MVIADVPVPIDDDDEGVNIPSDDDEDDEMQMDFSFDFKGKDLTSAIKQTKQKEVMTGKNILEKVLERNGITDFEDHRQSIFNFSQ